MLLAKQRKFMIFMHLNKLFILFSLRRRHIMYLRLTHQIRSNPNKQVTLGHLLVEFLLLPAITPWPT